MIVSLGDGRAEGRSGVSLETVSTFADDDIGSLNGWEMLD